MYPLKLSSISLMYDRELLGRLLQRLKERQYFCDIRGWISCRHTLDHWHHQASHTFVMDFGVLPISVYSYVIVILGFPYK